MSYLTQSAIATNAAMYARVAQCAASENYDSPDAWTSAWARRWAASPGWDSAWESALASHPDDGDPDTPAYDPGTDEAVITDQMILSEVQAIGETNAP